VDQSYIRPTPEACYAAQERARMARDRARIAVATATDVVAASQALRAKRNERNLTACDPDF
jgi:hypothetical protein